jgi:hypothetical protein
MLSCYSDGMARHNIGVKNGMWRGGRSVASNGYILIRVHKNHHLADCRGYAYEHRLVAEGKIGRRLEPGEQVHHKNGIKSDNRPENIEVMGSQAEHKVAHRGPTSNRQLPGEPNPTILCACGCGTSLKKFEGGRPRKYVSGHNPPLALTETAILGALDRNGAMSRPAIAAATRLGLHSVATCLSKMKRKGLVCQASRGIWINMKGGIK